MGDNRDNPKATATMEGGGEHESDHIQRLEKWIRRLKTVLGAQTEGVALIALDGRVRYGNAAMFEIVGYDEDGFDTIYGGFQKLFPDPEDMARAAAAWAEDIQRGGLVERTFRIVRGDGTHRWVTFGATPVGEEGFVLRARDVTDDKRASHARAQLEEQLIQSQKMEAVGTLAGGVAHDMNNVLGVIMGFASVLKQSNPTGTSRVKCVDGILAASRRGRDLTSNLLGFARKGSFRKEPFSLNEAAEEVQALLQRTVNKSVEIQIDLDPSLVSIEADAGQITHALMNLCLNSIEAMREGGVLRMQTRTVDLTPEDSDSWISVEPGRYAELVVVDDGAGMNPDTLKHAFEPFFTTKPKGQGTGLGLSMVYGTVKNHRGDIHILSAPQEGTRITLLLPQVDPDARTNGVVTRPSDTSVTIPARVLLVDDERLMLQAGKVLLETLGHDVVLAQSGQEAHARLQDNEASFDVVILDMIMPDMDGAETFHTLRQTRSDLCVLLCSGYPRGTGVETLIEDGAAGFLRKPFEMETLAEELNRLMRRSML